MIEKIKHIIIFGGGTSGWLTAAYMSNQLTFPCKITVIESKMLGAIGVGEGTQPATARFLQDAGLNPKDWMKPSHASFKYGVLMSGWNKDPYFVDNDFIENTIIAPDLYTHDYFADKPASEFFKFLPAYRLALANKSPKIGAMDHTLSQKSSRDFGAVHFSALDIIDVLRELIKERISYFDTKVVSISKDENGITGLIDEMGRTHTADLYIDCSGFQSRLLEKELGENFIDISDILPCDSAVAIPTQYVDPKEECQPYTTATAMHAGWRWTIPTYKQIGNGYVYSSKYITKEQAEAELRQSIGNFDNDANHLAMKCGTHSKIAVKNVIAVGLSAGFVEPLEATGITFTTGIVQGLTAALNYHNGIWNNNGKNAMNNMYTTMVVEIIAFVWAHYHFSSKDDTPFWKEIRNQKLEDAPIFIQEILSKINPTLHRDFYMDNTSSFHTGHWFSILHANNLYKPADTFKITGDQLKYAEYYIKTKTYEIDQVIDIFENHYEYLYRWYNE